MSKQDFSSIAESVLGTTSLIAGGWAIDQTSLGTSELGIGDTTGASQEDPELAQALSFGFGVGSSSYQPNPQVVVTLADNKPHTKIEEKAKKLYDKYDKRHIKEKDEGASMVIVDTAAKELFDGIIESSGSKLELISNLTALEESIVNAVQTKENTKEAKVKRIKYE